MAHFNFVISQNAKWGHAGFYIGRHRMTSLLKCAYCTEASNQKSKYAYRKIFFYKKALHSRNKSVVFLAVAALDLTSSQRGEVIMERYTAWHPHNTVRDTF